MKLTVEDIRNFPELKGLRLIAGAEGVGNVVTGCGILDYEYDNSVKEKYASLNFQKNQFILTSFLYAKNNEYLVIDAVKKLIAKGCSAMAVRNVFRLPFHDNLLRYADSMKFPIFLIEDPALYFEEMIIMIKERGDRYTSLYSRAEKVDAMLTSMQEHESFRVPPAMARDINASLHSDLVALSFQSNAPLDPRAYFALETVFYRAGLLEPGSTMLYYKNGFLLIHSCDMFHAGNVHEIIAPYLLALPQSSFEPLPRFFIGVSRLHHDLAELAEAFQECLYAERVHRLRLLSGPEMKTESTADTACVAYDDMGVYQLLLPFVETAFMQRFSQTYLRPLRDYDAENKTALLPTALRFVLCGGNIDRTAQSMGQHKNTVRYRLDRVSKLKNANILLPEHYEELSVAVKIYLCTEKEALAVY